MTSVYLHQMAFAATSGMPEDTMVNTFHSVNPDNVSAIGWSAAIEDFYTGTHAPSTGPLSKYMSPFLTGAYTLKVFNLGDPIPRIPITTITGTVIVDATPSDLPEEIAVCLSYKAAPVVGVPLASTRGRIYFGPLALDAIEGADVGDTTWPTPARPNTLLIGRLRDSAKNLLTLSDVDDYWAVYSPTRNEAYRVTNGFVDNAFDIQRRRGVGATSRTLWP